MFEQNITILKAIIGIQDFKELQEVMQKEILRKFDKETIKNKKKIAYINYSTIIVIGSRRAKGFISDKLQEVLIQEDFRQYILESDIDKFTSKYEKYISKVSKYFQNLWK